jgi:AcrR family transcriptional regulator
MAELTDKPKRSYRLKARAAAAEETARRILDAAVHLYTERAFDEVALEDIAAGAGVTVQTVLRRYGSKDRLIDTAVEHARSQVMNQRNEAPRGDITAAIENLVEHYETWGDRVLHLLSQEGREPAFRRMTDLGRQEHYGWVERTFAEYLAPHEPLERERLRRQLIATCDVYLWKVLRRDLASSRDETVAAVAGIVQALTGGK